MGTKTSGCTDWVRRRLA